MSSKSLPLHITALTLLVSCSGGGIDVPIDGPMGPPPVPTNAGGVWEGSALEDNSGLTLATVGVVTEANNGNSEARFVNEQGVQFIFSFFNGFDGWVLADFSAIAPIGTVFADGSTVTEGDFDGDVIERESLNGSWSLDTGETGTLTMIYDAIYVRGSALDRIAGAWMDQFGIVYSVDANGDIFAQDALGCVYDGAVSIINPSFNAYEIALSVSDCPGTDGDYSGLGVLGDDAAMDDAFVFLLDNGQLGITDVLLKL